MQEELLSYDLTLYELRLEADFTALLNRVSLTRSGRHSLNSPSVVCPSRCLPAVVWPCSLFCWAVRTIVLLGALFQTVSHYRNRYWVYFWEVIAGPQERERLLALALAWILIYASRRALDNQRDCQLVG